MQDFKMLKGTAGPLIEARSERQHQVPYFLTDGLSSARLLYLQRGEYVFMGRDANMSVSSYLHKRGKGFDLRNFQIFTKESSNLSLWEDCIKERVGH